MKKNYKPSNLTKENNEEKENFLGKKRKEPDTQSNIEDNEKIISSEEIEKANNPEGPIQNNNESFLMPKILQKISSNNHNDFDVPKINEKISKKDPPKSQKDEINRLLQEPHGFEKVIQILFKSILDEKDKVDSSIEKKIIFCLLYLNSEIQKIKDRISKMPPSSSPKKKTNLNNEYSKSLNIFDNNMILNESPFENINKNENEFHIKIKIEKQ